MHLRAALNGILSPTRIATSPLESSSEQLKNNPPADPKQVKKVKRLIRLAKDEENE